MHRAGSDSRPRTPTIGGLPNQSNRALTRRCGTPRPEHHGRTIWGRSRRAAGATDERSPVDRAGP